MAQSTMTAFPAFDHAPRLVADASQRDIPPPSSLRITLCAERWVVPVLIHEPFPAAMGGCGFTIGIGSEPGIGICEPRAARGVEHFEPVLCLRRQAVDRILSLASRHCPDPAVALMR